MEPQKKTIPDTRWLFGIKRNTLSSQPAAGAVPVQTAVERISLCGCGRLCNALRRLAGWKEIDHTLGQYIEHQVQERYFEVGEKADYFSAYPPCTVWPELRPEDVDDGLLRFACYVAVCYTVYGASYDSLTTEHILGLVSQIRPDMVKQLKTGGSGKLPKDIQRRKTEHFTASANDAFATIRITAKGLHRGVLWGNPGLPVRGAGAGGISPQLLGGVPWAGEDLPAHSRPAQKGNQSALCLRCAVPQSASGYGTIRLVWLCGSLSGTKTSQMKPVRCPAPFAVFALGLEGPQWCSLVCDYLDYVMMNIPLCREVYPHLFQEIRIYGPDHA